MSVPYSKCSQDAKGRSCWVHMRHAMRWQWRFDLCRHEKKYLSSLMFIDVFIWVVHLRAVILFCVWVFTCLIWWPDGQLWEKTVKNSEEILLNSSKSLKSWTEHMKRHVAICSICSTTYNALQAPKVRTKNNNITELQVRPVLRSSVMARNFPKRTLQTPTGMILRRPNHKWTH